jgi:hypothetical protein
VTIQVIPSAKNLYSSLISAKRNIESGFLETKVMEVENTAKCKIICGVGPGR